MLNSRETAFFTVACEKSFNKEDLCSIAKPYWAKGFLDISFNARELVSDATHYFALFFQFNKHARDREFAEPILYEWELVGATFRDAACSGWTVRIWLTTEYVATETESRALWGNALDFLVDFLRDVPAEPGEQIY